MKRLFIALAAFAVALSAPVIVTPAMAADAGQPQEAMDNSLNSGKTAADTGKAETKHHHKHHHHGHRAKTTEEAKTIGGSGGKHHHHKKHAEESMKQGGAEGAAGSDTGAAAPAAGQ